MNETICHTTTTVLTGSPVSREYEVRAFFGILSVRLFFKNFRVELNVFFKALHLSLLLSPLALWIILTWLGNNYFSETEEDLNALFSRRIV